MTPAEMYERVSTIVSPVYLVGGSVRDALMGRASADYDFASPLSAQELETAVRAGGRRAYVVGKKVGTVGLKVEGHKVEISSFRTRSYERGARYPAVAFLSRLEEDLAHRDFTINAMAMRGDEVVDPWGGRADIERGIVRAVGEARERFREDPLRMLRAARFASELGFAVETETVDAVRRGARRILQAARERWVTELDKLLVGQAVDGGLRLLAGMGLLRYMLPEVHIQLGYDQNSPYHKLLLFDHTVSVVASVEPDVELRWAALLHDVGKPFARVEKPGRSIYATHELIGAELVERVALYLRWGTSRRERVRRLVLEHMNADSPLREADDGSKTEPMR